MRLVFLALVLVMLAGSAVAGVVRVEGGWRVANGNAFIEFQTGGSDLSMISFEPSTGAVVLDWMTIDLRADAGLAYFNLTEYVPGERARLVGTITDGATLRVLGPAKVYVIQGAAPFGDTESVSRRPTTIDLPAGSYDILITSTPAGWERLLDTVSGAMGWFLPLVFVATIVGVTGATVAVRSQR